MNLLKISVQTFHLSLSLPKPSSPLITYSPSPSLRLSIFTSHRPQKHAIFTDRDHNHAINIGAVALHTLTATHDISTTTHDTPTTTHNTPTTTHETPTMTHCTPTETHNTSTPTHGNSLNTILSPILLFNERSDLHLPRYAANEMFIVRIDYIKAYVLNCSIVPWGNNKGSVKNGYSSFHKIPKALRAMPKSNPEGIYVNKNLSLDNIQVYGFDYDYTLVYYSANLKNLIYDLAKEHLVIERLYYDKLKGCLLKLDFFGSIELDGCYFDRRKSGKNTLIDNGIVANADHSHFDSALPL
uniref:Uncharacterized protein n=1 Tax=Cucumis melo TaxID=3656 RepID=A0A9I9EFY6_CUCME